MMIHGKPAFFKATADPSTAVHSTMATLNKSSAMLERLDETLWVKLRCPRPIIADRSTRKSPSGLMN
jgi:hypothetical protein